MGRIYKRTGEPLSMSLTFCAIERVNLLMNLRNIIMYEARFQKQAFPSPVLAKLDKKNSAYVSLDST